MWRSPAPEPRGKSNKPNHGCGFVLRQSRAECDLVEKLRSLERRIRQHRIAGVEIERFNAEHPYLDSVFAQRRWFHSIFQPAFPGGPAEQIPSALFPSTYGNQMPFTLMRQLVQVGFRIIADFVGQFVMAQRWRGRAETASSQTVFQPRGFFEYAQRQNGLPAARSIFSNGKPPGAIRPAKPPDTALRRPGISRFVQSASASNSRTGGNPAGRQTGIGAERFQLANQGFGNIPAAGNRNPPAQIRFVFS